MTLRQFWELNIKGNAKRELGELSKAGDKATKSFRGSKRYLDETFKKVDRGRHTIDSLEKKLHRLEQRQRKAWNPKYIETYNRAIVKTRREIERMNRMGTRGKIGGFGGVGGFASGLSSGMPIPLMGGGMAMGAGIGAAMLGADAGRRIMSFDSAKTNLGAITGAGGKRLERLSKEGIRMASTRPFTATETMEGMTFLGQAGYNDDEILRAMPHSMNLAQAGRLGLDRSADILSDINTQFGYKASDSDKTANLLAATARSANTNIEQAYEAFKYLGPTAKALKISMEETAAIIGVEARGGLKGSLAGRALGSSLVRLAKPSDSMKESYKQLGFQPFIDGEMVPMADMLKQLEDGTRNLTDELKQQHLYTIFGAEAIQEINILLEQGSEQFRLYQEKLTGTNEAHRMATAQMDSLKMKVSKMDSAWESLVLEVESGNGRIGKSFRYLIEGITSKLQDATLSERYGLDYNPLSPIAIKSPGEGKLIDDYKSLSGRFEDLRTSNASDGDLRKFQLEINKKKLGVNSDDVLGNSPEWTRKKYHRMLDDIRKMVRGEQVNRLKDLTAEDKNGNPPVITPVDGGSAANEASSAISAGGRRVRNVVVNIDKMIEGGVNYHQTNMNDADSDLEGKIQELLVRAVRGGELALVNGEG